MHVIQNSTCLELPCTGARQWSSPDLYLASHPTSFHKFHQAGVPSSFNQKNDSPIVPLFRANQSSGALTFLLQLEVGGASSELQGSPHRLKAEEPLRRFSISIVYTDSFLDLVEQCISEQDVALGRELYTFIAEIGLDLDSYFGSHLIRMFSSFNLLAEVNRIFSKISRPSVFAWNAIFSAYTTCGESYKVIRLYHEMRNARVEPDAHVSVTVLKACAMTAALAEGEWTHAQVLEYGLEANVFVSSALINMYSKCGQLIRAHMIFEKSMQPSLITWNALIAGYVDHGHGEQALTLFSIMIDCGLEPDKRTFLSSLKACSRMSALKIGEQIHSHIIKHGLDLTMTIGNSLIDMYSKCGSLQNAWLVFDKLPQPDVVSWSAMISGYTHHGLSQDALQLFRDMMQNGVLPNTVTFICVIKACAKIAAFEEGKEVHSYLYECGLEVDLSLGIALVDMYAKCKSLPDAVAMLTPSFMQSSVTWNALVGGYTECGHGDEALQLFQQMLHQGVIPDQVTFACILKACTRLEQCMSIHARIIDGNELDSHTGTILIDLYAKFGNTEMAKWVFDRLPNKNVVTWSTLIAGYVQNGLEHEAFDLFKQMKQVGVEPNQVTFLGIMEACASMAAVAHGKMIQAIIVENGLESNASIASALLDMYAKCGALEEAHILFNRLPSRDAVVWTTLVGGHAHHSDYQGALRYFKGMLQTGLAPDEVTLLCLLSACSHAALLDEGCLIFKSMPEIYGIFPEVEHYDCLLDLFSFAGKFDVSEDLLETIPFECNVVGWKILLGACRRHGNAGLGKRCFEQVIQHEPVNASGFALMSSTYVHTGLLEEAENLEGVRRHANAWKIPAKACIEVNNKIHSFTVGDMTHPLSDRIRGKLKSLTTSLMEEGYAPQFDSIPSVLSTEHKRGVLCGHSERLAIAFGLLSTPEGATLRISKNFRMCNDCHIAVKLISKVEKREIMIADTYCVHYCRDGVCSCRD
ncbi:hypothetical protein KP509_04G079600 [Ceratopteris richardii]|uniref:DYW domain-containing protein n=1 Tax=Ceratopteris richardii TaxID=49495 RepID=A0A8T2UYK6_CERRI|nr:hypothetical protein KP509_04G079600 [Ceratopteris richardii]